MSGLRTAVRAWVELLRLPALATVPGDALAGAVTARSAGPGSGRSAAPAVGASLCLYAAGMALNDWADREEDAAERPERPIPSGRVRPAAALAAATGLTAAGVALAARAGTRAGLTATALAATVWAYDLGLKRTPAGPVAMGAARGLDLLMGAAATGSVPARAWRAGGVLACHTAAVTAVSRNEVEGGRSDAPLVALAVTGALAAGLAVAPLGVAAAASSAAGARLPGLGGQPARTGPGAGAGTGAGTPGAGPAGRVGRLVRIARAGAPTVARLGSTAGRSGELGAAGVGWLGRTAPAGVWRRVPFELWACALYVGTAGPGYVRAGLNPSGVLTRRAVGGGIRAVVPLQAAVAARAGGVGVAGGVVALGAAAGRLGRGVSAT